QLVADGTFVPGALAEELLQTLLIIVLRAVDTLEALGHSAGTLAAAVEQQAAEIEFGPGATALAAEVGEYGIEVVTQFAPEALQALGIHSIDRLWTAAQLATRTNGVILATCASGKVTLRHIPVHQHRFWKDREVLARGPGQAVGKKMPRPVRPVR